MRLEDHRHNDRVRGCASDIWAAKVPMDYEAKGREADRELSGVEYVRNGPPGPILTLLRFMPPTTGLVVGAWGGLSRSVKQFVTDCAEKGSVRLPWAGPGPRYDRHLHQPRLWPGLLARRGVGPTRGSHSCHGLEAVCSILLATRPRQVCGGARALWTRLATGLRAASSYMKSV